MSSPRLAPESPGRATYWLYAGHLWAVLGIALSNILLGLAALAAPFANEPRPAPAAARAVFLPLGLFGAFVLVSCLNSRDPAGSLAEAGGMAFAALTLVLGVLFIRGEGAIRRVLDGLLVVGGLAALYGLGQFLAGFGGLEVRIRGPFSHYMTLAGVLLIVDAVLIAQLACGIGRSAKWRWALLAVVNTALLIGMTRGAWIALVVSVGTLLVLRSARWLWLYAPAVVLLIVFAPAAVKARIASIGDLADISTYDRICMVEAGLHMIAERPLFGVGPRMVRELYPIYRHPSAPTEDVPHLHNTFVQIAAETGIPTLLCFLWLVIGAMRLSYRGYRQAVREGAGRADLYLGIFIALLAFLLAGLFEDNWSDAEVKRLVLFLLAAPYCLGAAPAVDGGSPTEPAAAG